MFLKFQSKSFLFQFFVLVRVELEKVRFLLGRVEYRLFKLGQDFQMLHLIIEVAPVKLDIEDGFVEQLQLLDGELLWQQLEAYWLEVYLFAQLLQGHP